MREEICRYCKILWERSLVAGTGGNISVKIGEDSLICTPTLISKGFVSPEDLLEVDMAGEPIDNAIERFRRPTSEIAMHIAIYRSDPEIKAIVHTHPPFTCSYSFEELSIEREQELLSPFSLEEEMWLNGMVFHDFKPSGSAELARSVGESVSGRNILILKRHGLIVWDSSLQGAFYRTEIAESHFRARHLIDSRRH